MRPTKVSPLLISLGLSIGLVVSGCASVEGERELTDNDPPLSDLDDIHDGTPKNDDITRDYGKFDDLLPARFTDIRDLQSPVKSQGRRGVCSIFSTAGLMEHLYIAEGTITDLDVSEQYMQWSAKFEVNSFPATSGSNAFFNLRSISDFGVVAEDDWAYEINQWDETNDEKCTGEDDQPTRCYTNGHPTDEVKAAKKFHLPRSRSVNSRDIKGHMKTTNTAVVVGLTFFYQSWNHRKSELPTNSGNWDAGFVLYPNAKDRELSLEKRAGHSIVLVGWDDDLERPKRDENGDIVVDANGDEVTEKGFYLFKNSWGTSGFGINNEFGAGYGWISQRYVRELGRVRSAGLPRNIVVPEICDDNKDNDNNGKTDCDDLACSANPICSTEGREVVKTTSTSVEIPDNDSVGVSSPMTVEETGSISELSITVNVTHTFIGDLRITLERDGQKVVLHNRSGGGTDDLNETFVVTDFVGADVGGEWNIHVSDNAGIDTGAIDSWTLTALVD